MAAIVRRAAKVDIEIVQGETFNPVFTWKVDGTAVNLTGYTARMTIRDTYGGTSLLSCTTENSRITLGGAAGTITFSVAASDTAALTAPASGVYDLELVSGSTVRKLMYGDVTIIPEVTT